MMDEDERAKLLAPEEWAQREPVEGPCFTVVGAPEDVAKWPELALPWRIAAEPEHVHWLWGEWTGFPARAAEKWAWVRWMERYDGYGLPGVMRAVVSHSDGRQWRVDVEPTRVVSFYGHAIPMASPEHGGEG